VPSRDYLRRLADERYEGEMRNRILEAIDKIAGEIDIEELAGLIEAGRAEDAARKIGAEVAAALGPTEATVSAALLAAAEATAKRMEETAPRRLKVTFERGHRRVEERAAALHANKIREVEESAREVVRREVREGLERGENPRAVGRRIRGRWDAQAKAFRGGALGLTEHQQGIVANAEAELREGRVGDYMRRKLRDRRHDRSILKRINEGKALTERQIQTAVGSYRRKYTQYRAETIARDQVLAALDEGQEEAMDQALEDGEVEDDEVYLEWVATKDERTRAHHRQIPSMNPGGVPKGSMFRTPLGDMRRPRDRDSPGGRYPENVIQCRCVTTVTVRRKR